MMNKLLIWQPESCTQCMDCIEVCPVNAFETRMGRLSGVNHETCVLCGRCVVACPDDALLIKEGITETKI